LPKNQELVLTRDSEQTLSILSLMLKDRHDA